jgi:hypothetical protein
MKKTLPILQFEFSPLAKAGVLVRNLRDQDSAGEHAVSAPHRDAHYLLLLATRGRFVLHLDFEEVIIGKLGLMAASASLIERLGKLAPGTIRSITDGVKVEMVGDPLPLRTLLPRPLLSFRQAVKQALAISWLYRKYRANRLILQAKPAPLA